jgi:hypothetical protein
MICNTRAFVFERASRLRLALFVCRESVARGSLRDLCPSHVFVMGVTATEVHIRNLKGRGGARRIKVPTTSQFGKRSFLSGSYAAEQEFILARWNVSSYASHKGKNSLH